MQNSTWQDIRWNEAIVLFNNLIAAIQGKAQKETLVYSLNIMSKRVAEFTLRMYKV